jgi:hypothetical protein
MELGFSHADSLLDLSNRVQLNFDPKHMATIRRAATPLS